MPYQKNNIGPLLSFNINSSESSSQENSSNDIEKLQYAENQKLQMQRSKVEEDIYQKIARQQKEERNRDEFKVPKSRYTPQQLFKKQSESDKYARKSVLPKVVARNKKMPFSSTPKISIPYNTSSEIDVSPISQTAKYNNVNRTRTRSFDEIPPPKRLKAVTSGLEALVTVSANEKALVDGIVSKNKPNVTVRKTILKDKNKADTENCFSTIDILGRHELVNSRNLTFEEVDTLQNNVQVKHLLRHNTHLISPNTSCNLPYNSKDNNKVMQAKASFDKVLGLSASVISISSVDSNKDFSNSKEGSLVVEKKREVSKKSTCINTTKVKEPPKSIQKCTVSTQKNAVKDTSTNTTPYTHESNTLMEETLEKEQSRKSIGTNTSNKNVESKVRKTSMYKKNKTSRAVSTVLNNSRNTVLTKRSPKMTVKSNSITRCSLRPRTKTIHYSSSYTANNNNNSSSTRNHNDKPTSDNTALSPKQSNYTSGKQTKRRKTKRLIPASLSKATKSKLKKENEHLPKERLSGFYEMHMEVNDENKENNSTNARNRRPTSLFIQSHLVGPSSLKKVLLKRLTTNKVQLETTEKSKKTRRGSSVARKSVKTSSLKTKNGRKPTESISNDDDTTFKKPFPVKNSQTSASSSNSSVATVGFDKEPVISSPLIETIDEMSYDESSEISTKSMKEVSTARTQNVREKRFENHQLSIELNSENSSVKNKRRSSNSTVGKKTPSITDQNNEKSLNKKSRQKRSLENDKTVSKDSGLTTVSSNPVSSTNAFQMSSNLQQTGQFDIPHSYSTKLDVDPSARSPLNDAIYEITDSPKSASRSKSIVIGVANSVQSGPKTFTTDQQEGTNRSTRNSIKETSFNKPRKSVAFSEPIVTREKQKKLQPNVSSNNAIYEGTQASNNALTLSARRNGQQLVLTNAINHIDDSESEVGNKGALGTLINNKPVLWKNWNSDMPDLSSDINKDLVKYTMKNVPFVGSTFSSGCLLIPPGERKSKCATMKHYLFFHVLCGEALIKVQGEKLIGKAGFHFIVPLGSIYSITNASSQNQLVLFFVKVAPK